MFCCFDTTRNGVSSYPGNRRFEQYGDNAFSNQSDYPMPSSERVSATVPHGKKAGDQMLVSSSSGKCVAAIIPNGVGPGDIFMVDIPMDPYNENNAESPPKEFSSQSLHTFTKSDFEYNHKAPLINTDVITAIPEDFPRSNPSPSAPSPSTTHASQKLMLVQIPPGVSPGTLMNVQVPNENRLIPVQVPPGNVREFHVSYDCQDSSSNIVVSGQPVQQLQGTLKRSDNNIHSSSKQFTPIHGNQLKSNSQARQNGYYSTPQSQRSANNGGLGFFAPVLAGAAMLGTAGYMVHHHNENEYTGADAMSYGGDY